MMKPGLKKLLIGILAVLVILAVGKNAIAKAALSGGVKAMTGLPLRIDRMKVGLVTSSVVQVQGLKLYNPSGFQDKVMVDLPEVLIDYDLGSLLGGKMYLKKVRIDLNELVVVRNEKGELNLDALRVVQAKKGKTAGPPPAQKPIQIDVLELKVGKVVYKDYSGGGGKPSVQEFNVHLNERYTNITNMQVLASVILTKALMNTSIARLTNFDLGALTGDASAVLKNATTLATGMVNQVTGTAQQTVNKAGERLKNLIQ